MSQGCKETPLFLGAYAYLEVCLENLMQHLPFSKGNECYWQPVATRRHLMHSLTLAGSKDYSGAKAGRLHGLPRPDRGPHDHLRGPGVTWQQPSRVTG